ncbi:TSUP family transporter [Modestobacter sp. DSM 44400]|uniref:TSUP family transporter n=1 Tax=Modestobacter sp. DSM 44400 TaxID=1550230 RepID=UPI0015875AD7|nr:TSUP family transporter [Modestobacter sp. DSM 44400]
MTLLVAGAVVVLGASFLGGVTGFGFSLVCAPLLLLAGFGLADVVVINLVIGLVTRLAAAVRLHHSVNRRRSTYLVLGSLPGLLLGFLTRDVIGGDGLKAAAGGVAVAAAAYLMFRPPAPRADLPERVSPLSSGAAGMLGGFLGITTSLNGPPPVILLARQNAEPREFVADLAVYFIFCNALALVLIGLGGGLSLSRVGVLLACWLPGALVGNAVGLTYGSRLPVALFRRLTLGLVMVTGLITVATSVAGS